ncbi:amino acid:proton symporter, partial [Paraburkholderia silvatlantica]
QFGGSGLLPYGWDMLVVALVSLVFYYWGVNSGYRSPYLAEREEHDEVLEGIGAH